MAVVVAGAAGLFVWLGQRMPDAPTTVLAAAPTAVLAGRAVSSPVGSPPTGSPPVGNEPASPLVVHAEPPPSPPQVAELARPSVMARLPEPEPAAPPPAGLAPPSAAPPVVATPAVIPSPPVAGVIEAPPRRLSGPPAAPLSGPPAVSPAGPPVGLLSGPPAAPLSGPPAVPVPAIRPSFDIVRVTPQGEAVLAGRAAPGASVTITDNGRKIAEATGDREGQWVALPSQALPAGGQSLALSSVAPQAAAGGPVSAPVAGEAPLLVIVPSAPSLSGASPPASGPQIAVAILTPADAAPRVLQGLPPAAADRPASAGHPQSGRLGLDVVDYDAHGAIRFGGTAPPGAGVRAYVDNHPAGDARTDGDGHWSLAPAEAVDPGDHRLRIDQLGAGGHVAARIELPFERTPIPAAAMAEGRVVVQPRATLWRIARQAYGQGIRYTVIFQANRDQIRDPDMIFPGQVFAIPARDASADTPPAALAAAPAFSGSHPSGSDH